MAVLIESPEKSGRSSARFPQMCVRADRRSAIKSHGMSVRDALIQEWYNGREALVKDGVAGASRFRDGMGRHGDFAKIRAGFSTASTLTTGAR